MFFKKSGVLNQCLAIISANILTISYGALVGWFFTTALHLQNSKTTPLGIDAISNTELSWILSIMFVGGFTGCVFVSWMGDGFGKKHTLCVLAIPQILNWFLNVMASNATDLYMSSYMVGFVGGGAIVLIPLFISEISEDRHRGILGSTTILFYNVGMLLAFISQYFLVSFISSLALGSISIIFVFAMVFFYDTPTQLMKEYRKEKAEKSLQFYASGRRLSIQKSQKYQNDLKKMKSTRRVPRWSTVYFKTKSAKKALFIGIVLAVLRELCNCFILINYKDDFVVAFPTHLSGNFLAIIFGVVQLVGSVMATCFVDRFGRKALMVISCIGTAIGIIMLGVCSYKDITGDLEKPLMWLPITGFCLTAFFASCGILPLPYIIITETIPEKIRNIGTTICLSISWIVAFITIKWFTCIVGFFGLSTCIFFLAFCCITVVVIIVAVLPETNQLSYDEIFILLER